MTDGPDSFHFLFTKLFKKDLNERYYIERTVHVSNNSLSKLHTKWAMCQFVCGVTLHLIFVVIYEVR